MRIQGRARSTPGRCRRRLYVPVGLCNMAASEPLSEEYPTEIHESLVGFEESVKSADGMLKSLMSVPRSELLQKLDPLEQAKLDLASAYALNSMFWIYLVTQGINPKEHPVKQELITCIYYLESNGQKGMITKKSKRRVKMTLKSG
uniref:nuclear nucleic acid-binding protein C1D isoform X2 n=1 Tax=Pristiophorus japonicus TaxID=55135 RepID=UPI00398EDC3F